MIWKLARRTLDCSPQKPLIMGILNVTPDSFSDGGRFDSTEKAIAHALQMQDQGADIIDIGGESTRPNATPVSELEEIQRVLPVIQGLQGKLSIPLSIDTTKSKVAEAALAAGAEIVNDVSASRWDSDLWSVASRYHAGYVLMHAQGTPQTMQQSPHYENVVEEIYDFLKKIYKTLRMLVFLSKAW